MQIWVSGSLLIKFPVIFYDLELSAVSSRKDTAVAGDDDSR